ncbi:MAG: hypothetical protein U0172_03605 [Nitrospiraceae bacterium]
MTTKRKLDRVVVVGASPPRRASGRSMTPGAIRKREARAKQRDLRAAKARVIEARTSFHTSLDDLTVKHNAILRCFRAGAALDDLASVSGYHRAVLENVLRRGVITPSVTASAGSAGGSRA